LAVQRIQALGKITSSTTPLNEISQAGISFLSLVFETNESAKTLEKAIEDGELESVTIEEIQASPDAPVPAPGAMTVQQSIRVPVPKLDDLMNLSGELSISKNSFIALSKTLRSLPQGERLS